MRRPPVPPGRLRRLVLLAGLGLLLVATGLAAAVHGQPAQAAPVQGWVVAQPDPEPGQPFPPPPTDTPPPTPPPPGVVPESEPGPPLECDQDPGPLDIGGQVRAAIHGFFCDLVADTLNPVLETMGHTVLATPDMTGNEQLRQVWTANLVIANTIFVLFIVAGGFVIASRETLQTQYGLKELAPRVVIAGLAANLSLLLVGQVIEFANAVTAGVAGQGVDASAAAQALTDAVSPGGLLVTLLLIAIIVMAIVVVATFIIRVAVLAILIAVAPIALLFHALPQTEQLAFTWWRALAGCFAIQLGQTLVLVAAVRIFLTPTGPAILGFPTTGGGWLGVLVALAMLWLLVKIPVWVKEYLWLRSRGSLHKVVYAFLLLKSLTMAAGRGGRGGQRERPDRQEPDSPSPTSGPGPGRGPRPGPGPRPNPAGRRNPTGQPYPRHRPDPRSHRGPRPGPVPRPAPASRQAPSRTGTGGQPGMPEPSHAPDSPPRPAPSSAGHDRWPGNEPGGVARRRPAAADEPVRFSTAAGAGPKPPGTPQPARTGRPTTGGGQQRKPAQDAPPARPATSSPPRQPPPWPPHTPGRVRPPSYDEPTVPTARAPVSPQNPPAPPRRRPRHGGDRT